MISRRRFARQLRLLRALRYRVSRFEELARMLREGEAPPPRSVVLTIDDGYADNLEIALPLLRRHRFPATLFLVSRRLGGVNDWTPDGAVAGRPLLSLERARSGCAASGSRSAPTPAPTRSLTDTARRARWRTRSAAPREDLEAAARRAGPDLRLPLRQIRPRASSPPPREAGYAAACTVESRLARLGDDPLRIPRLEIRGADSPPPSCASSGSAAL